MLTSFVAFQMRYVERRTQSGEYRYRGKVCQGRAARLKPAA